MFTGTNKYTYMHMITCRGRGGNESNTILVTVIAFTNTNLKPTKSLKVGKKTKCAPRIYFELSLLSKT